MPSITWSPLAQQVIEADTLFLLDADVEKVKTAGVDGMMMGNAQGGEWGAAAISVVDVPGRYRRGLKSTSRSGGFLCMPMSGLLPPDEFTVEWWVKGDLAWDQITDSPMLGFVEENEGFVFDHHAGTSVIRFTHDQAAAGRVNDVFTWNSSAIAANVWTHLAFTFLSSTLKFYVNGVLTTTRSSVTAPRMWTDVSNNTGLCICGFLGKGSPNWMISDLRISRRARTPGGTITVDGDNLLNVDTTTSTGKTVQKKLLGGLLTLSHDAEAATKAMATSPRGLTLMRCGKLISTTPIKAGGTDGSHPTAGVSGAYSYDWRVVDHTIDYFTSLGCTPYIEFDAAPQILGGATPPYSGAQLTDSTTGAGRSDYAAYPPNPPNNFVEFGKICRDLVHYVTVTKGVSVPYWGVWNETDTGGFWSGTLAQYLDMYKECAAAVKAVSGALKVGGADFERWNPVWAEAMIAYCKANSVALDFISWHYYQGNVAEITRVKRFVALTAASYALSPVPEVLNGEWTWNNKNFPQSTAIGPLPWRNFDYFTNDHMGAFIGASLVEMQWADVPISVFTSPIAEDGAFGSAKDGFINSWDASGLMSQTNPWVGLNVFRAWYRMADNVVASTYTGRPGVFAVASKDATKVSVFIANLRYRKDASDTVKVQLPGSYAGNTVTQFVMDAGHSNARDAGLGHKDLETVAASPVAGDGSIIVTAAPRSVNLLEIPLAGGGDVTPPTTTLTVTPLDGISTSATFEFTSNEPGIFEGSLDGGAYVQVVSPRTYTGLSVASHTFDVRARDTAGNVDASPAHHSWTISAPPPANDNYDAALDADSVVAHWKHGEASGTVVTDRKGTYHGTYFGSPTLGVTGLLVGSSDKAVRFAGASSQYANVGVVAVDTNGTWEGWFKTTGTGRILALSKPTTGAKVEIAVSPRFVAEVTNDSGSNLFLDGPFGKDDGGKHYWALTKSGSSWALYIDDPATAVATGTLSGAITVDSVNIGRTGRSAGSLYFTGDVDETAIYNTALAPARLGAHRDLGISGPTTDVTPPQTQIDTFPSDSQVTSATLTFSANEAATFEVQLDGAGWTTATSPKSYTGLSVGAHTFQVRAIDTALNVDPTPATHVWTVQAGGAPPAVVKEELWLSDVGVVMNQPQGTYQGSQVLQAINHALTGDGVLRLNPGIVEIDIELAFNRDIKTLFLKGSGAATNDTSGTVLKFPVDLGPDKYAIRPSDTGGYPVHREDFQIIGPNLRPGMGQDVSDMMGIRVVGESYDSNVNVSGFYAGLHLIADHHELHSCKFGSNAHGIFVGRNAGFGAGDFLFFANKFVGNRRSSICIGTTHSFGNFTFINGHSGFSPVGIYRLEEGGAQRHTNFLYGGDFINHPFEACGDGVIIDEPSDGYMSSVRFAAIGEAGEATFHWKSYNGSVRGRGLWDVGGIDRVTVTGDVSPWFDAAQGFDLPWIYASQSIIGLWVHSPDFVGHRVYDSSVNGHPLLYSPFIENVQLGMPGAFGGFGLAATVANSGEALTQFDAVQLDDDGKVRRARNTNPYLGQVVATVINGVAAYIITNGAQNAWVRARLSMAAKAGNRLVVDPANPGKLKPGGALGGYDVVARAVADIAAGASGPVKVVNSQAT